jgi:hypothetical protein
MSNNNASTMPPKIFKNFFMLHSPKNDCEARRGEGRRAMGALCHLSAFLLNYFTKAIRRVWAKAVSPFCPCTKIR